MKPLRCTDMNTGTNRPTRRQFIRSVGATVASGALLPDGSIHPEDVAASARPAARIRKHGYPAPARWTARGDAN